MTINNILVVKSCNNFLVSNDTQLLYALGAYTVNTLWDKNGLHTFGNNSAESEPIWMRYGTVWAKCRGLALADFGWDLFSSYSLRELFFFKRQNYSQNFQVLQLQAVITPQWLQIAWNLQPNGPSMRMGCLVSILTVRIDSVFLLGCTLRTRKVPTQIFGNRWRSPWTSCWVMMQK